MSYLLSLIDMFFAFYQYFFLSIFFFFFFKQKTAYEMLRSLVGSEMCIRDRIMACDGIWDVMNNQEVGEFVVDAMDALADDVKAACEVLVERAYALGSTDNMTAMIVSVGASCPPA
eukprot:TRINITY_DN14652_c0_g1_i6.p1 TRINITY_DN14652_c0_g1~~TRINITY_DN14652_c0_g1_i6.p1  ORF type:complete len:116 (+),score=46.78 TRINITY_DN14652_c0_g1_i6:24-371(+)